MLQPEGAGLQPAKLEQAARIHYALDVLIVALWNLDR